MVKLKPVVLSVRRHLLRHDASEMPDTHAGLEHLSALESKTLGRLPHCPNDRLAGVVGVLDRPPSGVVL